MTNDELDLDELEAAVIGIIRPRPNTTVAQHTNWWRVITRAADPGERRLLTIADELRSRFGRCECEVGRPRITGHNGVRRLWSIDTNSSKTVVFEAINLEVTRYINHVIDYTVRVAHHALGSEFMPTHDFNLEQERMFIRPRAWSVITVKLCVEQFGI